MEENKIYYFISDTHFGHSNIIRYCKRPFLKEGDLDSKGNWVSEYIASQRTKEMDETIIRNWNERIKDEDIVFFLGDWGFTKSTEAPDGQKFDNIRPLLRGNIVFIDGSHDKNNGCRTPIRNITIKHGGKNIFLVHDPKYINKDIIWNFTGHIHGKYGKFRKQGKNIIVDLSVENWDYRPVDINEINQAYSEWCRRGCKEKREL